MNKIRPINLNEIKEQFSHLLPKDDDIRFYEDHGWYVTPKIIPENDMLKAIEGAKEFYDGNIDNELFNNGKIANSGIDKNSTIKNNEFVTLQKYNLALLGFHPLVLATAAILNQSKEIRLFADSLVTKTPSSQTDSNAVGWHTDKAYWPTCSSDKLLTAWIPMQDCTLDMGPLFHIDGSHKWANDEKLAKFYSFSNQKLGSLEAYLNEKYSGYKETPMLLEKGQVSFHSCKTIHASRANISSKNRMALAVHFQDESNAHQKAYDSNNELIKIGYDYMCQVDANGNPDYKDPAIFPKLLTD